MFTVKKSIRLVLLFAICSSAIMCMCSCNYLINYFFGPGDTAKYRLPSSYDTTDYALEYNEVLIRLTVYDDTTLIGSINDGINTANISVKYELFGTAYEYSTAKIYNADTNEYIDYVLIECDGKKLRLTAKNEEKYDPMILDEIKTEQSIFLLFNANYIELNAILN